MTKINMVGVDFHFNNGIPVKASISDAKKQFYCNGNSVKDFFDFACNQLKLIGFNVCLNGEVNYSFGQFDKGTFSIDLMEAK